MATSPNYGWSEPDNTSLVKDGAQAMRTLGDAIDTSVWNVGFGQAGKNKIINGDFGVWARGTSFSNPASQSYCADRFQILFYGAAPTTYSVQQQTFTPGTAPVAGYEGTNFWRSTIATLGAAGAEFDIAQKIENVRSFAGQTMTLSFWAKGDSARNVTVYISQNFGSGGSGSVTSAVQTSTLSTSWQRFTYTFVVPSVAGKTIGASSFLQVTVRQVAATGSVLDLFGVQTEAGSKATPFQTASGGSIQGELAMCQRYYNRLGNTVGNSAQRLGVGPGANSTTASVTFYLPVNLRTATTSIDFSGLQLYQGNNTYAVTAAAVNAQSTQNPNVNLTVASGLTANQFYEALTTSTAGYIAFNAEL